MAVIAFKAAEHRVDSCGIVINNLFVQLLERARKNHVVRVQDESVRRARYFETDVARVGQPGIEPFVDDTNGMAGGLQRANRLCQGIVARGIINDYYLDPSRNGRGVRVLQALETVGNIGCIVVKGDDDRNRRCATIKAPIVE